MSGDRKSGVLHGTLGIGAATMLSRLLGLFRVRLEATVLGGGDIASAWFLAFMIPNLFRRLLGEGALGSALIPLLAEADHEEGAPRVRRELAVVFAVLGSVLALIVLLVSLLSWGLSLFFRAGGRGIPLRFSLLLQLLPLLMPYAFFICLAGVIGVVLNYARIFFLPALMALLLNIFLISGLFCAWYFAMTPKEFLPMLALLVPLAGVIQLVLMLLLLKQCGFFPRFRKGFLRSTEILGRLWHLALPGFIGAAALQLSLIVDRSLAVLLGPQAVPALTYVDRIIDLPIGIFAVSLGTVLMAEMSRSASRGNLEEITEQLNFCLSHVLFLCIPMAAGMICFYEPIFRLLCLGGSYTMADLDAARSVAVFYGAGIPFFCSLKVIVPAFHARKKMTTTLKVSLAAIAVNIVLNLILMWPLRQGGIALATVISSLVNNGTLLWLLYREGFRMNLRRLLRTALRSTAVAAAAGVVMYHLWHTFQHLFGTGRWVEFLSLALFGTGFVGLYLGFSAVLRAPELKEGFRIFFRRRKA